MSLEDEVEARVMLSRAVERLADVIPLTLNTLTVGNEFRLIS